MKQEKVIINGNIEIGNSGKNLNDITIPENIVFSPSGDTNIEYNLSKKSNNIAVINLRLLKTNVAYGYNNYGKIEKYTPNTLILFPYVNESGGIGFCYINGEGSLNVFIEDANKHLASINITYCC